MDCISRSKKKLQIHQKKFVEAFMSSKLRGAIAVHGAGSGKTLLAVTTSKCYLDKYPGHTVVVITPASLLAGFRKELSEYSTKEDKRYRFFTYAGYVQKPCDCNDSLLIVDEAQNLKNAESVSFKAVLDCAKEANKVLLMSATPITNSPYDLEPLISLIHGKTPTDEFMFNTVLKHKKLSLAYFGCRLSFFENDPIRTKQFFPSTEEVFIPIIMNSETTKTYQNLENNKTTKDIANIFDLNNSTEEKDLQSFFNGLRRISSSSTQKLEFMIKFIKHIIAKKPNSTLGITQRMIDTHTDKFIIFTHFKAHGSVLIIKQLKKEGIAHGYIDGTVTKKKRVKVVDDYVAGKTKVILISAAGATGLNLFETGYMFLVEPSWNESEVIQVMARANRYMSHIKLPPSKRNVRIMKLMLIKPHEAKQFSKVISDKVKYEDSGIMPSIDVKMVVDSNRKQALIVETLAFLESKIPSLESCKDGKQTIIDVNKLHEMKRLSNVPEIQAKDISILTKKNDKTFATPQASSHKTLPKDNYTNNKIIADNLLTMSGVSYIKQPTTILFDDVSHVLVHSFLSANHNIYADVIPTRMSSGTIKKIKGMPRTHIVTSQKKYKLGVFNGYIDLETNSTSRLSNIMIQKLLKRVQSAAEITLALIPWSFYRSQATTAWLSTKKHKVARYVSPFFSMANNLRTTGKEEAEMVILRISASKTVVDKKG
jgi:hypothetical protein